MIKISTNIELSLKSSEKVTCLIQDFINEKLEESGCENAIVGVSGGIDSALVASLATRALGNERVLALLMPDNENSQHDVMEAKAFVSHLGIEVKTIPINGIFQSTLNLVPEAAEKRIALGNLKARIRMLLLYLFSNLENGLVLGTGNRSELLLGYFTKYGDGAADILPIGELYKVQVVELSKYLKLPKSIIEKAPSAGFWPGQTDQEELGARYELIDPILYCLVELKLSAEETAKELSVDRELVRNLKSRWINNRHKRALPATPDLNL